MFPLAIKRWGLVFLTCFASTLVLAQQAGVIEQVEGDARIYAKDRSMRSAVPGEAVFEGETVETGRSDEVHLAMTDEGQIAVRPNTRMQIVKYRAEGDSEDRSVISLVKGAMRSVTGWIGKYNQKNYVIRTPTATIGVRGTDHETLVIPQGGEGEAGTYDKVNHGATLLSTAQGQMEVRPNQAGFAALSGKARPRLLPSVPHFFRPARLDRHFANLHEQVRERMVTKRAERIEKIRELRKNSPPSRSLRDQGAHDGRGAEREMLRDRIDQRRQEARQRQNAEDRERHLNERHGRADADRYQRRQESPRGNDAFDGRHDRQGGKDSGNRGRGHN